MMSFDDAMKKGVAEKIIADDLGIIERSSQWHALLATNDPIAKLAGSPVQRNTGTQPVYVDRTHYSSPTLPM